MADPRCGRACHRVRRRLRGRPDRRAAACGVLAEKQLEEIERLYATAPIGLGFLDADLRFVRVNERLAQMDGLAAEAHVGRRLAEVVPEVAASMEGIYRELMATGVPLKERELLGRRRRSRRPARLADERLSTERSYGTVVGVTVAVSDITERKRWSEELERQEALLRLVIDGLPGMVFYVDRDQRYRFANRAARNGLRAHPRISTAGKSVTCLASLHSKACGSALTARLPAKRLRPTYIIATPIASAMCMRTTFRTAPRTARFAAWWFVQDVTEQKRPNRRCGTAKSVSAVWWKSPPRASGSSMEGRRRRSSIGGWRILLGYTTEEMLGRELLRLLRCRRARARRERNSMERRKQQDTTAEPQEYRFRRKDSSSHLAGYYRHVNARRCR